MTFMKNWANKHRISHHQDVPAVQDSYKQLSPDLCQYDVS